MRRGARMTRPPFRTRRADRPRPDRLLHQPRHPPRRARPAHRRQCPDGSDAQHGAGLGLVVHGLRNCGGRRGGRRPGHPVRAGGRLRPDRGRDRPPARAGRHPDRRRLGEGCRGRDVGPHVPAGVHFVPGHPIAGTEHSGPESGFAELFEGAGASSRRRRGPTTAPWSG